MAHFQTATYSIKATQRWEEWVSNAKQLRWKSHYRNI
jgi:hypothetical protein